jgi:hypothetical protein
VTQQIAPLQAVPKGTIVEKRFEIEALTCSAVRLSTLPPPCKSLLSMA